MYSFLGSSFSVQKQTLIIMYSNKPNLGTAVWTEPEIMNLVKLCFYIMLSNDEGTIKYVREAEMRFNKSLLQSGINYLKDSYFLEAALEYSSSGIWALF